VVSTLKLTKIQIPNSDSDVISLDASNGNITVPKSVTFNGTLGGTSITVQGEGTATTNLQQGLVKAWLSGGNAAEVSKGFNVASGTDNGTGDYTYTYTNNLSSSEISGAGVSTDNSDQNLTIHSPTTSTYRVEVYQQNGSNVDRSNRTIICGDLA